MRSGEAMSCAMDIAHDGSPSNAVPVSRNRIERLQRANAAHLL